LGEGLKDGNIERKIKPTCSPQIEELLPTKSTGNPWSLDLWGRVEQLAAAGNDEAETTRLHRNPTP
jgi:hypothetical protein